MILDYEVMLALGIIGFYLYDSSMLIYVNELVFSEHNGTWSFSYPKPNFQFLKKFLYIPNPLTPYRPIFRVFWSVNEINHSLQSKVDLQSFITALRPLRYMTYCLCFLLFFGLPIIVFILNTNSDLSLIFLFCGIYINILVMLSQIYRQKETLGLSRKVFVKLSIDSLACPPFALNLLRKISLNYSLGTPPVFFARHFFPNETFEQLINVLSHKIDDELKMEDKESDRHIALEEYKNKIMSMLI